MHLEQNIYEQNLLKIKISKSSHFCFQQGGNPLSSNSSETNWNFLMPFYRMNTDSLRMVYVHFHRITCQRDFSMNVLLYVDTL